MPDSQPIDNSIERVIALEILVETLRNEAFTRERILAEQKSTIDILRREIVELRRNKR